MPNLYARLWIALTGHPSQVNQARQAQRFMVIEAQAKRDELKALILKG